MYTGAKCLERLRTSLSQDTMDRLNALHNKDAKKSFVGLIATNAFGDDDPEDGQTYVVLRIYDEISRTNHSCVPTAVMEYDAVRGMGVLRAVMRIRPGDEIFINYLVREEHSLLSRDKRREELHKHYGFTCHCPICNVEGQQRVNDDHQRNEALRRYSALIKAYQHRINWQTETIVRLTKLTKVTEYIGCLQYRHIIDGRLG